ncbi:MAG TPA: uracil-DNA glycosylase [Acidimicrobiales bacterium]|nr:uracil-DNA glycosylase [Acidimicrobiales bacterium]
MPPIRRDRTPADPGGAPASGDAAGRLGALRTEIVGCRRCERLVAWREDVAATGRAAYAGERYWQRPLPGWGDLAARLVVVGLAPAAHGANRTGRMFTGDRTGDFLFAALWRAGYANQPESVSADDGLRLSGAYVTAAVRCAPPDNRPAPGERDNCAPYLAAELDALVRARVLLALGAFALDALVRQPSVGHAVLADGAGRGARRPKFAHGLEVPLAAVPGDGPSRTLLCSYHPSQRNVFTGLLTPAMFDAVLTRARELGA